MSDDLARYHRAVAKLDALIDRPEPVDTSIEAIQQRAKQRLARVGALLADLGDPHLTYPVIHVGGTSGKGSTAVAAASMLAAAGYRVGLHTSPYLQVPTEKLTLGGRLIVADDFARLVDQTLARADQRFGRNDRLTYAEAWATLPLWWFARQRVDAAVVEVGAGGRFDATNVVEPAVAVITTVGLDHVATLGATIPEIAWHKAGIIKPGSVAITGVRDPAALAPIVAEAEATGAPLKQIVAGESFEVVDDTGGTAWRPLTDGRPSGPRFSTAAPGRFQAANAALALSAVRHLAPLGLTISDEAAARGLAAARLPGRLEEMPAVDGGRVILDAAHNPDKIAALASAVPTIIDGSEPPVVVFGALDGKAAPEMLAHVAPIAGALVLTAPRVLAKPATPPMKLVEAARAAGFTGEIAVEPDPLAALDTARAIAGPTGAVLVTGSLYLVGNVRSRWYPDEAIVRERTPWPAAHR